MGEPAKKTGATGGQEKVDINSQLEWIRFREETLGPAAYSEQPSSRFFRKMTENPLVPIGALTTLFALSYGLWCFRKGKAQDSQKMMRLRVGAQGFTIVAILGGIFLGVSAPPHRRPSPSIEVEAAPAEKP